VVNPTLSSLCLRQFVSSLNDTAPHPCHHSLAGKRAVCGEKGQTIRIGIVHRFGFDDGRLRPLGKPGPSRYLGQNQLADWSIGL